MEAALGWYQHGPLSPSDPNGSRRSAGLLLLRVRMTSVYFFPPLSSLRLLAAWHNSPVPPQGRWWYRQICLIYAPGTGGWRYLTIPYTAHIAGRAACTIPCVDGRTICHENAFIATMEDKRTLVSHFP